jgi:hypothetical protein
MRARLAVLTAILFSLGCAGEVDVSEDNGVAVTFEPIIGGVVASAYPEAAYLNIDATTTSMYVCSGTLIAPKVVLTAGHCVDGHSKWEVYVAGAYRVATRKAVYDWYENGSDAVNPKHHDIGLLFLNEAVKITTYPTIATTKLAENAAATCVGRVDNGVVKSGAYQANTAVSSGDSVGYPYAYKSSVVIQKGDSGGPVFKKGTHEIAAVNSGANTSVQVLARVDLLASWIAQQIASEASTGSSASAGGSGGASARGGSSAVGVGGSKSIASSSAPAKGGATAQGGASSTSKGGTSVVTSTSPAICSTLNEIEPNNSFATAKSLPATLCGQIASKTDTDWFTVTMPVGAHQLALQSSQDAVMNVGVVSRGSCVVSYKNARAMNVTVSGSSASICLQVVSPAVKPQSYQLRRN